MFYVKNGNRYLIPFMYKAKRNKHQVYLFWNDFDPFNRNCFCFVVCELKKFPFVPQKSKNVSFVPWEGCTQKTALTTQLHCLVTKRSLNSFVQYVYHSISDSVIETFAAGMIQIQTYVPTPTGKMKEQL